MKSWETGASFRELLEQDPEILQHVSKDDIRKTFNLAVHFKDINRTFRAVGL